MGQKNEYQFIPQSNSSADSARIMKATATSEGFEFLTQKEKDIIQWINIARMYPKWYIYFRKLKDIDPIYTKTLISKLMTMEPIKKKIIPSKKLWEIAQCHASTAGPVSHMGHDRVSNKCKMELNAECIHYGGGNAAYKVQRLLIDKGVPSLGHRKSMLNRNYKFIGVSIMPFGKAPQSSISVIDFSN